MKAFWNLLRQDLKMHLRARGDWCVLILFFFILLMVLPLAIGPDLPTLSRLAPGMVWLAALLVVLLSIEKLWVADVHDGTLDMMRLSPMPLVWVVCSKLMAHNVVLLALLGAMVLPACVLLGMDVAVLPVLLFTFLLGVPSLVCLGGLLGAITATLNRNAAFLILLLIPFYIPVLIFAVGACDAVSSGDQARQALLFLAAMAAALVPSVPLCIAHCLRRLS